MRDIVIHVAQSPAFGFDGGSGLALRRIMRQMGQSFLFGP